MDETAVRELLNLAALDKDAPPCQVSIRLARSRGRRRLRLHRIYLPGAAPVAAAAAVVLIITLSTALGGGSSRPSLGSAGPRAAGPAVAPGSFNPLAPYASFGWLPAGFSAAASSGVTDQVTTHALTLQAAAPPADGRVVAVTVDTAGSCRIEPTSLVMAARAALRGETASPPAAAVPAQTLSCTDPSPDGENRIAELASAAPDVNGEPAYWTPQGALEWRYARGAWAEVLPTESPAYCATGGACTGGKLAGWITVPASVAERGRSGVPPVNEGRVQPQTQSAASKVLLVKIAASLRYGDTTPLVFGFEIAGLPDGWQPADNYSYELQDGRLAATSWSAGPTVDPTALAISVGPAVSATSEYACKVIAGQTSYVTVDGARAVLRNLNAADKQFESLCANDIDGVAPYVALDLNVPGSDAGLPGGAAVSNVLTVFQSVRLLGPDPAAWTTNPLG
jgi:hypothetical protein